MVHASSLTFLAIEGSVKLIDSLENECYLFAAFKEAVAIRTFYCHSREGGNLYSREV
jgi:hypothetical protein